MALVSAFTMLQVVKLTGVSARQITYWENDVFRASFIDERPGRPYRRVFTFSDVVSLRTLGILRNEQHIPLGELRKVGLLLSHSTEFPWTQRFWILDRQVYFADPIESGVVRNVSGQSTYVVALDQIRIDVERESNQWTQRAPEDVGTIVRHRNVMHNKWVVKGTRIPTESIWGFARAGYSVEAIIDEYPTLTSADVRAATEHEDRIRIAKQAG